MADNVAVGEHQVFVAIVVKIDEPSSPSHEVLADGPNAGQAAGVVEVAPSIITIKSVGLLLIVRDKQRKLPGPAEIRRVDTHTAIGYPRLARGSSSFDSGLQKFPASIVEIEMIIDGVIGDIDVQLAILIKIRE